MKRLRMHIPLKLCIVLLVVTLFSGCGGIYKYYEQDGFHFTLFPGAGKGVADGWTWDGDKDNMVVTIPDICDGYRITQLGGRIGYGPLSNFEIYLPTGWYTLHNNSGMIKSPNVLIELDFTVNIGKNLSTIKRAIPTEYFEYEEEDGSYTYYRVYAYVNCSEENPTFYSKDGRLYYRENDELVNAFNYR